MLEAKEIHLFYGDVQVIHNLSLTVQEKNIIALLGSNGAGKTTLIKAISRLLPIRKGKIYFQNQEINSLGPHELVALGIIQVPEGRRIFPKLSVKENLEVGAFAPRARKVFKSSLDQVFSLFPKLHERQQQLSETLSGGEQQMLAIGRALMSIPSLLMLDEPSLGLAPLIVKHIFEIIKSVNHSGVTILLVEQNIRQALTIAEYGYILENGSIVLQDLCKNLLKNERVKKAYLGYSGGVRWKK